MPQAHTISARTVTLYAFDELPDEGRERAIEREHAAIDHEDYACEWRDSLAGFVDAFPLTVPDWEVSSWGLTSVSVSVDEDIGNLRGVRAFKWLTNNMPDGLLDGMCSFTGTHSDEPLLDPLREFTARPDDRTLDALLTECVWSWANAWEREMQYRESDEGIAEDLSYRDMTYLETGEIFFA